MKIIIIGCGRIGAGLAKKLISEGHSVTVVDQDPSAFEQLGEHFKGRTITGVGFDQDVLLRAGIKNADCLAAVTPNDEANVIASKIARDYFHVPKVVTRLYDINQAEIYKRLGIQTITPVAWGINRIAELLLNSPFEVVSSIGSGEVDLVEMEVPMLMISKTVSDFVVPGEINIVTITRDNKTFLPTLGTVFQRGDLLHLAVLSTSVNFLKEQSGF